MGGGQGRTRRGCRPVSVLVAGIGCSNAAEASEIIALIDSTLLECGRHPSDLACLATLDTRAGLPVLAAAARHFEVPLRCFSADDLQRVAGAPSPSEIVRAHTGLSGVAEVVALLAGPLLVEKRKSPHATCALGEADTDFDPLRFGRPASLWTIRFNRTVLR